MSKMIHQQQNKINDLQVKISDLEAKLAESKEQVEIVEKQHGELLMTIFDAHKESFELKQQLAEKENSVVLKPDKYVIVTNGWKKQGYGIAKIHQEVRDIYYYCSNNQIGSFSPMGQYGEFETIEEAQAKLKEVKGKKK